MRIQAAVVHEAGGPFVIEELELAEPQAGELLVRVVASGICGTDEAVRQQHAPVELPAVLGHEGSGIVERVGVGVAAFKPGDRVCFSFASCGCCEFCLEGKPYRCEHSGHLNFGGYYADNTRRLRFADRELPAFFGQSSFASHAVVSERGCVLLKDDVPLELAAPFGCGIQTGAGTVFNVLDMGFGQSLAVFGLGTVGMSALMAARIAGCDPIVAVGGNPATLALAQELGATRSVNRRDFVGATDGVVDSKSLAEAIRGITGKGVHASIDTSGNAALIKAAINSVRYDGTIAVMAPSEPVSIDLFPDLIDTTRRLVGVMEGAAVPQLLIPRLLEYWRAGRFPIERIMTFYPFAEINQAFADSTSGTVIKAVLQMESPEGQSRALR